ncbi:SRPBCC domain-containing protein [Chitinophaga pendula]|uniref:SRPBCC family protein n=1 Tax=Chitinophaga TaxID=79328 RepID=UPI000BAF5535|nr:MULTISPECIES: SRPBCC domain-containing protein [Chitinophaga]ASZ12561.1 hypothetical protein CK934_17145 [Chitinophaga sp. MD30]UCJ09837.1 SRPBCC domain-containing protein [Chitinophaga pendula]
MPNIRHSLLIAASRECVYEAITSAKGLSSWWTPGTEAIPQVGSVASFPFGDVYVKKMKIVELLPSEFVKWSCIQGDQEWIGTTLSFRLLEQDNKTMEKIHPEIKGQIEQNTADRSTLVLFQHDDWSGYTPTFAECSYTWAQFLKSLKLLCETGKGKPWPFQHSVN